MILHMKNAIAALALLLFAAAAFGHAGHVHTFMGTVSAVRHDGSFAMKTTDGKEITVATNASTAWLHADGKTATHADLATGMRVVVKTTLDGKTAASVKMSK
jgi:hypothetical protein